VLTIGPYAFLKDIFANFATCQLIADPRHGIDPGNPPELLFRVVDANGCAVPVAETRAAPVSFGAVWCDQHILNRAAFERPREMPFTRLSVLRTVIEEDDSNRPTFTSLSLARYPNLGAKRRTRIEPADFVIECPVTDPEWSDGILVNRRS
jgi:hypothetical protein